MLLSFVINIVTLCQSNIKRNDMKKIMLYGIIAIVSTVFFTGCNSSKQVALTVNSNPPGASIITQNTNYGYAPATIYYTIDDRTKKRGYVQTAPIYAKWVSGAEASTPGVKMALSTGNYQSYSLNRPNVKGYAQDAQFGLQVQTMQAQQAQARAAQKQAKTASASYASQQINNIQRNNQIRNYNSQVLQYNASQYYGN